MVPGVLSLSATRYQRGRLFFFYSSSSSSSSSAGGFIARAAEPYRKQIQPRRMAAVMGPDYWCHQCHQVISPVLRSEISCPQCDGGFVEQIGADAHEFHSGIDADSVVWASSRLGRRLEESRRRRRRSESPRRGEEDPEERGERSRVLVAGRPQISHLMQILSSVMEGVQMDDDSDDNSRLVIVDPSSVTLVLQGGLRGRGLRGGTVGVVLQGGSAGAGGAASRRVPGAFGDYFLGSGLDLLIQHLAENDPNRYGTPPAAKSAVEAIPTVRVSEEHLRSDFSQCAVCMEDFVLAEATRQIPCKHMFHAQCILPWLELHSSCPVCRFQLPVDDQDSNSKKDQSEGSTSGGENRSDAGERDASESTSHDGSSNSRRFSMSIPWPFNGLFASSQQSQDSQPEGSSRDEA